MRTPALTLLKLQMAFLKLSVGKSLSRLAMAAALTIASSACTTSKKTEAAATVPEVIEPSSFQSSLSGFKKQEYDKVFFDGMTQVMLGNYQRAIVFFEQAIRLDNSQPAVYFELGMAYAKMKRHGDAEIMARKAVQLDASNKWYQLLLIDMLEQAKKYDEVAARYDALISKYPTEPEYYFNLAGNYLQANRPDLALKTYDRYEKVFGPDETVLLQKNRIYIQLGKLDKAIEEMKKLVALESRNVRYRTTLAQMYIQKGQNDKAMEVLKAISSEGLDDGQSQLMLAEFYEKTGNSKEATRQIRKAFASQSLSIDPKIEIFYNNFLSRPLSPFDLGQADTLLDIITASHPQDAKAWAVAGDFNYRQGRLPQAKLAYKKSLVIRQDVYSVWQQLLFIESELRDDKGLEETSNQAIEFFPSNPIPWFFKGVALNNQKKFAEAIAPLEAGLKLVIDQSDLEAQLRTNLAEALYRTKNFEKSDAQWEAILKTDPNNALALNNFAYYLSERNVQLERAEQMSAKSLKIDPTNASYLDTYGWILYQQGKYAEAEKYIAKSLAQETGSAEVLEHYGDVLFKLGKAAEAQVYWQRAKSAGGDSAALTKKISEGKL